ncbi:hypothetical protein DDE19_31640 [Micromonospora ureilytica]|uniref:Uncharacterized protein n=1 Tax=Micromonospora ureilytica TaxID=709868 RepID=A0A3N9XVF2_9ACTN|nr:hypothetical protein DDE19_31640 [Micromonospora ureilytica]
MTGPSEPSMRSLDRLADRIRQHRQADKRPVLVVEGPSDKRVLDEILPSSFPTFPAGNRSAALSTAKQLKNWGFDSFYCVVDRDFDSEVAVVEAAGIPVHPYENADLEAMLAQTDGLRRLVEELGSNDKLRRIGGLPALRQILQEIVVPLGRLRAANSQRSWGLPFDDVDLASKIGHKDLSFNLQGYCAALSQRRGGRPSATTLIRIAQGLDRSTSEATCPRGSAPYYRGKDLMVALGVGLRSLAGTSDKALTDGEHLARILRAIAAPHLARTAWLLELHSLLTRPSTP